MKKIEFEDFGEPVDLSKLEAVERRINCKLPPDYRAFLLQYNGGTPSIKNRRICIKGRSDFHPDVNVLLVDLFFPVNDKEYKRLELIHVYSIYNRRIPATTIPIASTPFGDLFLIEFEGRYAGSVCFWEHDTEGFSDAVGSRHNTVIMYNSFREFVDALGPE